MCQKCERSRWRSSSAIFITTSPRSWPAARFASQDTGVRSETSCLQLEARPRHRYQSPTGPEGWLPWPDSSRIGPEWTRTSRTSSTHAGAPAPAAPLRSIEACRTCSTPTRFPRCCGAIQISRCCGALRLNRRQISSRRPSRWASSSMVPCSNAHVKRSTFPAGAGVALGELAGLSAVYCAVYARIHPHSDLPDRRPARGH